MFRSGWCWRASFRYALAISSAVADFETPLSGPYHLELTQKVGGQVLYQQSRGISVGYSDELRLKPTNETLLKSIADASGGKHQLAAADVFASTGRTARRRV